MVAKSVKWVLAGLLASPTAALALGLGDVHLLSRLDAPLDANIDLLGATPDELASLTPKIASRATFAQHGLDWPAFLSNVKIRAVHLANGHDVLELRSTEPVTEPFLTVLVELDWDRGHFVREYTMLFDPPLYTPNAGRVARQAIEGPTSGASANEGTIRHIAPRGSAGAPAGSPRSAASAAAAQTSSAGPAQSSAGTSSAGGTGSAGGTYLVRRGDTLSRIAAKLGAGDRAEETRWMMAAYEANPDAFDHNINVLRSGTVLRIPSRAAIDSISAAQATVEVHRQYVAWRDSSHGASAGEQPGRLRLVAPNQAAAAGGTAGAGAAGVGGSVKALQGEVQSLQAQLAASRRLLDMRDTELAQLQAKLAARTSAATDLSTAPASASHTTANAASASAAPVPAAAVPATPSTESASAAHPVAGQRPPAGAAKVPAGAAARMAHKPVRRPVAARSTPAPGSSWVDAFGHVGWALAALVAALLAFLGFRAWNSRRKAGFDDSLGRLAEAGGTSLGGPVGAHDSLLSEGASQLAPKHESNFVVEETGTHERPRFDSEDVTAPAARHVEADDTISSETAINLDQGDPLAEADFHMAYGLYDQAADLVRIAIQREPERRDLKLKLLEVFFVWGNKEQFLATARDLASTRTGAAPGEWEKIVIMGKQLAPEDPLFASGAAVSGAAAGGVDLDLEGGQDHIDFDVLGTPAATAEASGVDLDIGTAIGERDPAAEAAALRATDRNLALDESLAFAEDATVEREAATATQQMLGDSATGSTREMTARTRELASATREMTATLDHEVRLEHEATWDSEEALPEGPTVEQPVLAAPENSTIRQKVEMALRAGASEHTTELALDDLGLDLTMLAPAQDRGDGANGALGHDALSPGELEQAGHDTLEQPAFGSASDAPTLVAGLDEHSRELMESAARRAGSGNGALHGGVEAFGPGEPAEAGPAADGELRVSATGTWHFDGDPLAGGESVNGEGTGLTGLHVAPAIDASETSRLSALDFDVSGSAAAHANGADGIDLDVGTATVPDAAGFGATTRLAADALALPDLDPVTMSEVGTKLDLARAYMDMGDPEGARNILEEVLGEGSAAQKQEAERLIASLPG